MANLDTFAGCFVGLALGDSIGAPFEGGLLERVLWNLIGKTRTGKKRYTDDTQMGIDVAESLLANRGIDQDHLAKTFATSYRWSRGYGAGAAKMLKKIRKGSHWQEVNCSVYPEGSYGNGAAMRAPIAALYFYGNDVGIINAVNKISAITHAHPLAKEGAELIALATSFALSHANFCGLFQVLQKHSNLDEFQSRLQIAQQWIENQNVVDSKTVVQQLGNGIAALDSCVTALYISSRYIDLPFTKMLEFIEECSGDTDTIGAMAGAIWGAYNGLDSFKPTDIDTLESSVRIEQLAQKLYKNNTYHA